MSTKRPKLSHLSADGTARMVDVAAKAITQRRAVATGHVLISPALHSAIAESRIAKGNLLDVARIAGIQGAKETARLIPLCHPLPLDAIHIDLQLAKDRVNIRATVVCTGRTGVEMEALTAVAVAALTVVDMGKAVDPAMEIAGIRVLEKAGGKHGLWRAPSRKRGASK